MWNRRTAQNMRYSLGILNAVFVGLCFSAGCEIDDLTIMPSRDLGGRSTNATGTATSTDTDNGTDDSPSGSTISYSGVKNIALGMGATPPRMTFDVDLNNYGGNDFLFRHDSSQPQLPLLVVPSGGNSTTDPLSTGASINDGSGWQGGTQTLVYWIRPIGSSGASAQGTWAHSQSDYMGVQFISGGNTYYGWIRISASDDFYITVHDWAYETRAGVEISAGDK